MLDSPINNKLSKNLSVAVILRSSCRGQAPMTRHWSESWLLAVRWTCWIYVLNSARSLQHLCTKWFRYVHAYRCTPYNILLFTQISETKNFWSFSLIIFCYCRVIPQVTTVKPCCCCVAGMMHKPCHPLCLGQIPWLSSQLAALWDEGSVHFWSRFRTNYKNTTFQISWRILLSKCEDALHSTE